MIKPASLREQLTTALPELRRDPDKLLVSIDRGSLIGTLAPGLSFEYRYTLNLVLTDFAGHPDAVMVPLLAWVASHQPELLANPSLREQIAFEADILDHGKVDLQITLPLTERVGVHPRAEGGYTAEHYPEPQAEAFLPGEHWQLFLAGELIAEWGAAPIPLTPPLPAGDGPVVVLAQVPLPAGRTVQFASDDVNVLWRYTDESLWHVLHPLPESGNGNSTGSGTDWASNNW